MKWIKITFRALAPSRFKAKSDDETGSSTIRLKGEGVMTSVTSGWSHEVI